MPGRQAPQPAPVPAPLTDLQWSVQLPPGAEPPPSLKAETLTLEDVRLVGVTAYTREQLADLFQPFLGKEITFEQFYGISQAIQKRYRDDGYILTFAYIPPQTVEDGVFTIAVVEGFVEGVQIRDTDGRLKETLTAILEPITRVRPLNVKTMERYLLLANDLAGVKATAVLRPSQKTRGATVMIVRVRLKPFGASVAVDNRSSDFTGPWGSSSTLIANSPMGYGERFEVNASEAMVGNEKRALSFSYDHPLGTEGLKFSVGGSFTRTTPGSTLRQFEVRTKTTEATVDLTYPVIRSRAETLSVGAGFTLRNASVNLLAAPFNKDRLRLLRAQASYGNSTFLGGSSRIVVSATQSLKGLDATNPRKTTMSRADAVMDFARLNVDVSHARHLFSGVNIRLSGYATESMPASEEFSLGGSGFGRAYNSGEVSGEDGFGIAAETTYNLDYRNELVRFVQTYGFFDFGKA